MSDSIRPGSEAPLITDRIANLCPPAAAYYRLLYARGPADSIYYPAQTQKPLLCKKPHAPQYPSAPPGAYLVEFYDEELRVIPPGPGGPPSATISYGGTGEPPAATGAALVPARSPALKSASAVEKDSKEKLDDTKNQVAESKLHMDNELRMEGVLSHQTLHQHFRSMAESLEDLRQVIMQLGKQDLVEQLKMQRLISEQTRQSLEQQLQTTDLLQQRMAKMEPPKPLADLTTLGTALIQAVSGIWMASLASRQDAKEETDEKPAKKIKRLPRPASVTAEQGEELMQALLASSMQLPQAVGDPKAAQQIVNRIQGILGQEANEEPQSAAADDSELDQDEPPDVKELPHEQRLAWYQLDRCRIQERLLIGRLKEANRRLSHAKDEEERTRWRQEIEDRTLALIACRREARKFMGKPNLPPNIKAAGDKQTQAQSEMVGAGSGSTETQPAALSKELKS